MSADWPVCHSSHLASRGELMLAVRPPSSYGRAVIHPVAASPPRAWAEIDLPALKYNLRVAREASGCAVMPVVKASA